MEIIACRNTPSGLSDDDWTRYRARMLTTGISALDYDSQLAAAIDRLHSEGRYRTFIDIARKNGQYPHATWHRADGVEQPVTVWCGNDYLGMGQHPVVLAA